MLCIHTNTHTQIDICKDSIAKPEHIFFTWTSKAREGSSANRSFSVFACVFVCVCVCFFSNNILFKTFINRLSQTRRNACAPITHGQKKRKNENMKNMNTHTQNVWMVVGGWWMCSCCEVCQQRKRTCDMPRVHINRPSKPLASSNHVEATTTTKSTTTMPSSSR